MHRLSSKVARPLTLARIVQNGQRRYQLPTLVGSFVAIRGYKTPTNVKFDKLLSILRNAKALEPDHAAKLVAALLVTAQSQAARDEAQKLIDQKLSHLDTAALFDRVNGYIENPPKDSFASLLTNGEPSTSSAGPSNQASNKKADKPAATQQPVFVKHFSHYLSHLKPGMSEDNAATVLAALLLSVETSEHRTELRDALFIKLEHLDPTTLFQKAAQLSRNPPDDQFHSLLSPSLRKFAPSADSTSASPRQQFLNLVSQLKPGVTAQAAEKIVADAMSISSAPSQLQELQVALRNNLPDIDEAALFDRVNEIMDAKDTGKQAQNANPSDEDVAAEKRFNRILALVTEDMEEGRALEVFSGLGVNARTEEHKKVTKDVMGKYLQTIPLERHNFVSKFKMFVAYPPADHFESLLHRAYTSPGQEKGRQYTIDPLDELAEQLGQPSVQTILKTFAPEDKWTLQHYISLLIGPDGTNEYRAMHKVVEFLEKFNIYLVFSTPLPELGNYQVPPVPENKGQVAPVELALRRAEKASAPLQSTRVQAPTGPPGDPFPDLMTSDPLLDIRDEMEFPPTKDSPYHNKVIVRSHKSIFTDFQEQLGLREPDSLRIEKSDIAEDEVNLVISAGLREDFKTAGLYSFPLLERWTSQQTSKGKIKNRKVFIVLGDGKGLVGLGSGEAAEIPQASRQAYIRALRNLDYVERFEDRTIWTNMEAKFGATRVVMRPRPVGFGLRCSPILHQILKAAGIKDISAKVWGSRNPMMVMNAAMRMLQGGHAPLAMGDGIGGKGRKKHKGSGMRTASDVERDRGRRLVPLRK